MMPDSLIAKADIVSELSASASVVAVHDYSDKWKSQQFGVNRILTCRIELKNSLIDGVNISYIVTGTYQPDGPDEYRHQLRIALLVPDLNASASSLLVQLKTVLSELSALVETRST